MPRASFVLAIFAIASITYAGAPVTVVVDGQQTVLDTDTEFDSGSGIEIASLSESQAESVYLLTKIWGFLKYHHAHVTTGRFHWDYEYFRALSRVLSVDSPTTKRAQLVSWISGLGTVEPCNRCAQVPKNTRLIPRLGWIGNPDLLGSELSQLLMHVYRHRSNYEESFYVVPKPGVGSAQFVNEAVYEDFSIDDMGYRLLAVARFWNIIEYWSPYRDEIDHSWDETLREFIQKISAASTVESYHRELTRLIGRISDSHAKWFVSASLPPRGHCLLPYTFRFVNGSLVVWATGPDVDDNSSSLSIGDVIDSIDGERVANRLRRIEDYYPGSNRAARLRDIARFISRGECGATDVGLLRDGRSVMLEVDREVAEKYYEFGSTSHDRPGDALQSLSDSVVYLKVSAAVVADIPSYIDRARNSEGLIIDLRGYPKEFILYSLGQHLVDEAAEFARFTRPDFPSPGAFVWGNTARLTPKEPTYAGKIVLLVDETTQSQAEFTTMAFGAAKNAVVVGSTTAGANGNYSLVTLPGRVRGGISGIGVFHTDQRRTQRKGLVPDLWARPTIEGIADMRDEVLEVGVRAVLGDAVRNEEVEQMARRYMDVDQR